MPSSPIQPAQQTAAKVAGIAYLITFAIVVYVNFGIYERLIVEHDATETARNILTHERLFRIGIAVDLIYCAGVIVLLTALYVILKPVSQDLGLRYSEFECLPTTRCNFTPDKASSTGVCADTARRKPIEVALVTSRHSPHPPHPCDTGEGVQRLKRRHGIRRQQIDP